MIWKAWLLLRPVLEHLCGRLIWYTWNGFYTAPYPYRGLLRRIFQDSYMRVRPSFKSVAEILAEPRDEYFFYQESPQPHRWVRRKNVRGRRKRSDGVPPKD